MPQCPKILSAKEQADCSAHKDLVQTKDSLSSRGLPERFEDAAKKAKICKAKRKIQKKNLPSNCQFKKDRARIM